MDIKKILFRSNSIDVEKATPDALILCSTDGKIQWVNDATAEKFETSRMHLLTSNIMDFIENPMNMILNAINTNKPVIVKTIDKEMYFDMTAKQIEEGYVLDIRDAVNLNLEKDENVCSQNLKNEFLLNLTNDLKSPIQSIVGFSQAMADGLGGKLSEQQEKYIKIINKNSTELMYFIAKLLELSQTEIYNKSIDAKTFDVTSLISGIIKYNQQLYKDKELNITIKNDDNFKKTIASDEYIIKFIVQNLIEVMIKAIDIGDIEINLSNPSSDYLVSRNLEQGNYVLINVLSSSLLLSEKELEFIFDPYKIMESTNRKNVLRAIVLASVKNLVQKLNGSIWVESKILKNTTISVLIPV